MPLRMLLDYESGVPVYKQIVDAVIAAMRSGALGAKEQLPTIHELARRLEVNPNTVVRAYRELEHGGYIVSERGRGTFPNADAPKPPSQKAMVQQICRKAVSEAEKYGIDPRELLRFLEKELT